MTTGVLAPMRPCSVCGGRAWQRWGGEPVGGWVCAVCAPRDDAISSAKLQALRTQLAAEDADRRRQRHTS
jgi:hypothetical protein